MRACGEQPPQETCGCGIAAFTYGGARNAAGLWRQFDGWPGRQAFQTRTGREAVAVVAGKILLNGRVRLKGANALPEVRGEAASIETLYVDHTAPNGLADALGAYGAPVETVSLFDGLPGTLDGVQEAMREEHKALSRLLRAA